jgi:hypothetical protein
LSLSHAEFNRLNCAVSPIEGDINTNIRGRDLPISDEHYIARRLPAAGACKYLAVSTPPFDAA